MLRLIRHLLKAMGFTGRRPADRPERRPAVGESRARHSDNYFELLEKMLGAKKSRDWEEVCAVAHRILDILPGFVSEWSQSYGQGLPPSIPVFDIGGRAFALTGDASGLERLKAAIRLDHDLQRFLQTVEDARRDADHVQAILRLVKLEPGIRQTDIAHRIGAQDSRRASVLIRHMSEGNLLTRTRYKKTYCLALPGVDISSLPSLDPVAGEVRAVLDREAPPPVSKVNPRHGRRQRLEAKELSLEGIEYIPLPRTPSRWEAAEKDQRGAAATEDFEVSAGWSVRNIVKLGMEERPDTAYRILLPHGQGAFMIDDLGKADAYPTAASSILSFGRDGEKLAEAGLEWDVYRLQVHPLGQGVIALSSEGIVHAYNARLESLLSLSLVDAPEMPNLMARYQFDEGSLKNHTRSVALSPDGNTFLFSVVDSVYVIGTDGTPQWAVSLPKQDGWKRVGAATNRVGTSSEVLQALDVLDLRLPVTLHEVRSQYRRLAKDRHPDLNQGSQESTVRFQELGAAAELLSGLELQSLAPDIVQPVYERVSSSSQMEVGGIRISVLMQGGEKTASDWVYASSFAADGGTFIAGYSGRIVQTDRKGMPWRAYDIGGVPRRIADTGDYLYFLTDTRLYILRGPALVKVLDVYEEGELVVGHEGFGLLDKKRFRWYTEQGELIGEVTTKRPIRRVFPSQDGIVVETRMRRAEILGPPRWWTS